MHFGGGRTSYEAFAVGLPFVTLPSPFLRSRLTFGMYKKMQITDGIAGSPEEYVDIAVRLGTEADYRTAVRARILEANRVLYEDAEAVREFERFFEEVSRTSGAGG
jgi:predicted O-linked N-acetylglucosamine transferase (SPINDLY family)